jgi:pimeloyl-ACP methyl ester carboxylesterase
MSVQPFEATVRAKDGTSIGFIRLGTGPSLVIVHGSITTGNAYLQFANILAEKFTCYVMDRRGRGRSGNAANYSIEREYEDVQVILEAAGPEAYLFGHSYGAIIALGAALHSSIARLILYEPPLPIRGPVAGPMLETYRTAVEANQLDDALAFGLEHFASTSAEEIALIRSSPQWGRQVFLAPTWVRELEAIDNLGPSLDRYKNLNMPVLLLTGSKSKEYPLRAASEALSTILPHASLENLQGQGHTAHLTAPQMLADVVANFLLTTPGQNGRF